MRPLVVSFCLTLALAGLALEAAAQSAAGDVPKEWLTEAEASDFASTPTYDETIAYLRKVEAAMPDLMKLSFYGSSGAGRPLPLVVLSKDNAFTAKRARRLAAKPIVLIQNGIHAGEIDGKDACLMILRDLALGRNREILDAATIVILPIYNVDGHERISPHNRPNQDGPRDGMGFRTTAAGLDLNRDHLKLGSEEARALVALVNSWRPHLHVDDHVTDGADHAWVLTYSWAEAPQAAPPVDAWMKEHMPKVLAGVTNAGWQHGPYVDLVDGLDPTKGFASRAGSPRFSSGYFALRNRPSILIEMHSYKPYKERVLANRDFLLALLREIGRDPASLVTAVADAEARTVAMGKADAPASEVVVRYEDDPASEPIRFPVFEWAVETSQVTGAPLLTYRPGTVKETEVPWYHKVKVGKALPRPRGYLVLPGWPAIEQRLRWHGLQVQRLTEPVELEVETARLSAPTFAAAPYQGLTQVESVTVERKTERRAIPAGALWIPADQPDFELAVQLLEADAPDSLLAWGLISNVFERKEYIEPRVLEQKMAEMLKDPKIAAEWRKALEDEAFAKNGQARYQWWYRRTPHWDETIGLMPVYRVMAAPTLVTRPWG